MVTNNTIFYPVLPEDESIAHSSHSNTANTFQLYDFPASSWSPADNGAPASSSQSHRQAEKRRRDRINGQLSRLRKLVPMSDKMDKAALLERVVDQIKDLKKDTTELSKFLTIPTETDDVIIECNANIQEEFAIPNDKDKKNVMLIKATFCCEDRPDLIPDLIRALKGLDLTTVGADIACLGGRIKSNLILYYKDDGNSDLKKGVSNASAIKQSLKAVLTRLVSWSTTTSSFRVTSKRQRFFFSS